MCDNQYFQAIYFHHCHKKTMPTSGVETRRRSACNKTTAQESVPESFAITTYRPCESRRGRHSALSRFHSAQQIWLRHLQPVLSQTNGPIVDCALVTDAFRPVTIKRIATINQDGRHDLQQETLRQYSLLIQYHARIPESEEGIIYCIIHLQNMETKRNPAWHAYNAFDFRCVLTGERASTVQGKDNRPACVSNICHAPTFLAIELADLPSCQSRHSEQKQ